MSISLKSIQLSNFRKHKSIVFHPATSGITSISAPNGFGKSTIVDSLSWVLFGTKPAGVSKASELINWDADVKSDKIFVEAVLKIDKGLMKVERKIVSKGGAVECRVWWIENEGDEWPDRSDTVAGPGVSHAEPYIRQRLHMDEAGFLTAVLVQQKQVDTLISSRPKERAAVIERMTGIEAISSALSYARSEHSLLKKQSQLNEVDEGKLEESRGAHEKAVSEGRTLYRKYKTLKADRAEKTEALESMREKLAVEEERVSLSRDLHEKKMRLDTEIALREDNLKIANSDKEEAKKKISYDRGSRALSEIEKEFDEISESQSSARASILNIRRSISDFKAKLDEANSFIEETKQKFSNPEESLRKALSRKDKAEKSLSDNEKKIIENRSQISRIEKAIKTLENDGGKCPTCLQEVEELSETVSLLEGQKNSLEEEVVESKKVMDRARKALSQTEEIIERLKTFEEHEKSLEVFKKSISDEEIKLEENLSQEKVLSKKRLILEKEKSRAENEEENRRRYEDLLNRAQRTLEEIESRGKERESVLKKIDKLKVVSDKALESMRKKVSVASDKLQELNEEFMDTHYRIKLLKKEANHLSENMERMEKEIEDHRKLLEAVEIASTSVQVIDEFRDERMKTTLPAIEVYASELLSQFTDGKLESLQLDSKFNATVTNSNGVTCPVGLLSAGELSAAALALRIAISMLFYNDGNQSLIILDEVLVSQDASRVESILETIKSVCKGQVVLIAHNPGISSIADKIIDLSSDISSSEDSEEG